VMQALGVVAYDDEAREYRMRAYNDGRYLETTLKLADNGLGIAWGFRSGEIRTSYVLKINEKGEWTELAHIMIGSEPPRKFLELRVSRQAELHNSSHHRFRKRSQIPAYQEKPADGAEDPNPSPMPFAVSVPVMRAGFLG